MKVLSNSNKGIEKRFTSSEINELILIFFNNILHT